jgi:hypothetical protein
MWDNPWSKYMHTLEVLSRSNLTYPNIQTPRYAKLKNDFFPFANVRPYHSYSLSGPVPTKCYGLASPTPLGSHVNNLEWGLGQLNHVPRAQRFCVYIVDGVRVKNAWLSAVQYRLFARGIGEAEDAPARYDVSTVPSRDY